MIILKYLVWETFKKQLVTLSVLLLAFFCQKLLKILSSTVSGKIPTKLVLFMLGLGIPEIMQLILPLSLFLSILMTFGKLYAESEIIVMHACGLSKILLMKAAMLLALFTGIIAAINVMWIGPFSSRYQEKMLAEVKVNPSIAMLAHGQFQQSETNNSVLFIESINGNHFKNIFFAQLYPKWKNTRPSVIIADYGQIALRKDGLQVIMLNKGTRFEGTAMLRDFRITNFQNYQAIIGYRTVTLNPNDTEQMYIHTLINTNTNRALIELNWRITLVFTVFMMAMIAIPLSVVAPRQNYMLSMLPAILLYMLFFLLQTSIKSSNIQIKIEPIVWIWTVNSFYLLLAICLNLWDTVLTLYFRTRFFRKRSI